MLEFQTATNKTDKIYTKPKCIHYTVRKHTYLPMKDFGMVILSHTLSFTSRPELGDDKALAILYIGVWIFSLT